jgi:glycosyltransferase involved in cell wall biosynthesis
VRLLMVTPRYPPFTGGIELHVEQLARRLATRGVKTTVLTTDPTGDLPQREHLNEVEVRRVRAWPANRDYYFAPGVYDEISRGEWDVVHVHSYLTFVGPLAMLAALRSRVPYVVTFHAGGLAMLATWRSVLPYIAGSRAGSPSARLRLAVRPLQLSLVRPLLARADRLIALARFEVDHYSHRLRLPSERFVVIPNGSDLPRAVGVGATEPEGSLVASVGRLEFAKGHHRVLAALPHIVRRRPEARLWIAGSGPYETELRRLADRLHIADRVEIRAVPPHERERMANELARASVVVLLSEFETQPLAALEALSLGCRLVIADTPGLTELADEGFARRIPLESSPKEVAAVVLEELGRPRNLAPPKLPTWDASAEALQNLYMSVLHSRQP